MTNRTTPKVDASSTADIAFLLLIFFLVTTTMDIDKGISQKLPTANNVIADVNQRNVLEVNINKNNQIMIEGTMYSISEVKDVALKFIDNGEGLDKNGEPCTWCTGSKDKTSSEHPSKAIIKISSSRETSYGSYIQLQNELRAAYSTLRNNLTQKLFHITYKELLKQAGSKPNNVQLKSQIKSIKAKYPQLITEAL